MTNEELDHERAHEAQRLFWSGNGGGKGEAVIAARLAREGWTPPPPADPDLLAVREIVAREWDSRLCREDGRKTRSGANDLDLAVRAALAAYKAGREAEVERLLEFTERWWKDRGLHDFQKADFRKALATYKTAKEAGK